MEFNEIIYQPGRVAQIILNRPQYLNAQSWLLRNELDTAFDAAVADRDVGVIVVSGMGGNFSAGHDIGTPEDRKYRSQIGHLHTDSADECYQDGFVNRVFRGKDLKRETLAYANRVAENYLSNPMGVETTKRTINHMVDAQGFSAEIESGFESFAAMQGLVPRGQPAPQAGGYARTDTARANFIASRSYVRAKVPGDPSGKANGNESGKQDR